MINHKKRLSFTTRASHPRRQMGNCDLRLGHAFTQHHPSTSPIYNIQRHVIQHSENTALIMVYHMVGHVIQYSDIHTASPHQPWRASNAQTLSPQCSQSIYIHKPNTCKPGFRQRHLHSPTSTTARFPALSTDALFTAPPPLYISLNPTAAHIHERPWTSTCITVETVNTAHSSDARGMLTVSFFVRVRSEEDARDPSEVQCVVNVAYRAVYMYVYGYTCIFFLWLCAHVHET
jgi:hypothetical protein